MANETKSTCPYCGVGCGVIIESDGDQITGVRGDPDHPANFGRLCTKGSTLHLTASAPITRQSRLLHPMRREHRGEKAQPRLVGRRAGLRHRELRPGHPRARARCGGLLHLRPVADRGLLRLQQAGQGAHRHEQRGHQLAPLHEQRGGGLQDDAGRRRAAQLLRRREPRAVHLHRRQQHGLGAPDPVPAHRRGQGRQPADEDHLLRSAPHGHGRDRRPVPAHPARHRRDAVQWPAAHHAVGRLGAAGLHCRPHQRLRRSQGHGARLHARPGGAGLRHQEGRPVPRGKDYSPLQPPP